VDYYLHAVSPIDWVSFLLPFFHAALPGMFFIRCCLAVLNSSPISPRCSRKTLKSYLALSALNSRFLLDADLAFSALAAKAKQN